MTEIYGLYDPTTNELRYVGKANNSQSRLSRHLNEAKHLNRPICLWIRGLLADGKVPIVRVLETVQDDAWKDAERRLIAEHRKTSNLLNLAPGGDMPSQTLEQRQNAARASWKAQNKDPKMAAYLKAKRDHMRFYAEMKRKQKWDIVAHMRFMMKIHAADMPHLCGEWAAL